MIVTARIHDREKFITGYGPAAAKLIGQFGGKYVVRAPGAEVLEGEGWPGASGVISEWPDKAAAYVPPPDLVLSLGFAGEGRRIAVDARSPGGEACLQLLSARLAQLPILPAVSSSDSPAPPSFS